VGGSTSRDPNVGISLARSIETDLTEPLFLAILSAATAADAIELISSYKRLLCPEHLVVRAEEPGRVVLTYRWPAADRPLPQTLADAELAFIVEMCRRGTRMPELSPIEIQVGTASLAPGSIHADFFRCPIRLGAADPAVVLREEDVDRPFVTFNAQMLAALLPYLQASAPPRESEAVARVRSVVAERLRGQRPSARTVAKELAMSTRTLQRLLRDHGTSFREVLDQVRNDHARGYLTSTSFSDSEISFLLGFEDPNSFYRAFRAWNGMSPSEFRGRPNVRVERRRIGD
jgi:AraC-like DNA-binding protein